MKTRKKILAIILAALFVFAPLASVAVGAADGDTYTVTVNLDGHGEDIVIEDVAEGAALTDVLEAAIPEAPTAEGYVAAAIGTKPVSGYSSVEELAEDAFALSSAAVESDMLVYIVWFELINEVRISIEAPACGTFVDADTDIDGDYIWSTQTNTPVLVFEEPEKIQEGYYTNWLNMDEEGYYDLFVGELEGDNTYLAGLDDIYPAFPYAFDSNTSIIVNGEVIFSDFYGEEVSSLFDGMWGDAYIPVEHDWGEWYVAVEPGPRTEGLLVRECNGDPSHFQSETIPELGGGVLATYDLNGGIPGEDFVDSVLWDEDYEWTVPNPVSEKENFAYAPEGFVFDGVEIEGIRYAEGDTYVFTKDVTVKLLWKAVAVDNNDNDGGIKKDTSSTSPVMGGEPNENNFSLAIVIVLAAALCVSGAICVYSAKKYMR